MECCRLAGVWVAGEGVLAATVAARVAVCLQQQEQQELPHLQSESRREQGSGL